MSFEPKILGFMCNWCSYAAADLAGVSRFQYPPYLRIMRVMCSARVDPVMVIEGFLYGADGVLVLGCHFGDCHYSEGNYYADRKMKMMGKFLNMIGINEGRLWVDWVSAAEGEIFANIVTEFTARIKKFGPLGKIEKLDVSQLKERLRAARLTVEDETVRWLVGKERELIEKENTYHEKIEQEDFDRLMTETLKDRYLKSRIKLLLQEKEASVKEIAERLNIAPGVVLEQMVDLQRRGAVGMGEIIEEKTPEYRLMG